MMKMKIKNLGTQFLGLLRAFVAWAMAWAKLKLSPPLRVRMTRQSLMISLPESQGSKLHVLPRPGASGLTRTFEVVNEEGKFALRASPDATALATYDNAAEAALALSTLNKALTRSQVWKWSLGLFLVWLTWLFVTSYIDVSRQNNTNGNKPDVVGFAPGLPNIPADPPAYQAIPSAAGPGGTELSAYIFQQAKAAQKRAQNDALPPKAGADNAAGLSAFGLKGAESNGSGEGCDPKLAFKVPGK